MRKSFFIKLALLIIPILIFASVPFMGDNHPSIGGGSYDLTDLYSGFFILLTIIVWIFFIIAHSIIFRKNNLTVNDNMKLLAIGLGILIIACAILFNTWIT